MPTSSAHAARPARLLPLALLVLATLCLTMVVPAAPARAAGPFVVNVSADASPMPPNGTCSAGLAHDCTLREAVQEANFAGGAATISFASVIAGATITLLSSLGSLDVIGNSTIIDGTDKNITISGANLSSGGVFRIQGNSNAVKNLTIKNAPQDGIQIGDYDLGAGKGNSNSVSGVKLISNGGAGVYIKSGASGGGNNNIVRASLIGALAAAPSACTPSQGNTYGIAIDPDVIGTQLLGNTIICNATNGVSINGAGSASDPTRMLLYQNLIGVVGSTNLGNGGAGVAIYGDARRIDVFNNMIAGNHQFGVYIAGAATNAIALSGNLIGTSVGGNSAVPNLQAGVVIDGVPNAAILIGGTNTIAGNVGAGVWIKGSSGVTVKGNAIGTNIARSAAVLNTSYGVQLSDGAHDNLIGGSLAADRNLIGGNGLSGVYLQGAATTGNRVAGNYIGTNVAGSAALPNGAYGVQLADGAHANTIGGNTAADRNLISGNKLSGVYVQGTTTTGNTVVGNYIGTNAAGSAAIPNRTYGVQLADGAHDNSINGTISARNLISGNTLSGVSIQGAATANNQVAGNYIGTNAAGSAALPNGAHGVLLVDGAHANTIGGSTAADRNLISGNGLSGVYMQDTGTTSNQVDSNYIGLSAAGSAAVPNGNAGVTLNGASGNQIGSAPNTSQFISGNAGAGIYVVGVISDTIGQANRIGVGANETTRLGNGGQGVVLTSTLSVSVFAKLVAYNGGAGVAIISANSNANEVLPGAVHDNGGLPIDLGDDGPTPNDADDADFGPDTLLNYPVITASSGRVITGTVCFNCQVWIYRAIGDAHAPRGGGSFIAHVTAGAHGGWSTTLPIGLTRTDVSAIACEAPCDTTSNVSEMSPSAPHVKLYLPLLKR
jgi:CSLREA domain-containing protein